jgi:hypothetical protein
MAINTSAGNFFRHAAQRSDKNPGVRPENSAAQPTPVAGGMFTEPPNADIYDASSQALLLADAQTTVPITLRPTCGHVLNGVLGQLGGPLVLIAAVARLMTPGGNPTDKISAVPDSAWGAQTVTSSVASASGWGMAQGLASQIGILGGALQAAIGAEKAWEGFRKRDLGTALAGSASVTAGLCWAVCSLGVAPLVTGAACMTITLAEKCYQNRKELRGMAKNGGQKFRNLRQRFFPNKA